MDHTEDPGIWPAVIPGKEQRENVTRSTVWRPQHLMLKY